MQDPNEITKEDLEKVAEEHDIPVGETITVIKDNPADDPPVIVTRNLTEDQQKRLDNNFTYHPPFGDLPEKYGLIRGKALKLAIAFCKLAPESRELSLALTKLEEAVMWVNAAIARNEKEI